MSYTLDFIVKAADPAGVNRIAEAVRQVADRTKLSADQLGLWRTALQVSMDQGNSFNRALGLTEQAFKKGDAALVNFTKNLREAIKEQERAERQAQRTESAFTRIAVMFAGQQSGIPIPGGVRNILSILPGGGTTLAVGAGLGAAGLIANQVRELTNQAANYGREITNLSIKTGLTVQETQLFSRAAEITGTNVNGLVMQVRTLSKALIENSDEGRKAKEALKEFLPSGTISQLPFMQPGAALRTIYGGLGTVQNPFEQSRIASTLFGRSSSESLLFAQQLGELTPGIRAAGGIFSDEDIKKATEYKKQTELLGIQYDALKTQIGISLIPAVGAVVGYLRQNLPGGARTPNYKLTDGGLTPDGGPSPEGFFRQFGFSPYPKTPDAWTLFQSGQAGAIQSYLERSQGARGGRSEGLERQKRAAELDLSAAIDRNDLDAVKHANEKVISLEKQIDALKNYEQTAKRIYDLEAQADLKKFQGPFGAIAANRRIALRDVQDQGQRNQISRLFAYEMVGQPSVPLNLAGAVQGPDVLSGMGIGTRRNGLAQETLRNIALAAENSEEHAALGTSKYTGKDFAKDFAEQIKTGEEIRSTNQQERQSIAQLLIGRQGKLSSLTPDFGVGAPERAAASEFTTRMSLAKQLEADQLSALGEYSKTEKGLVEYARIEKEFRLEGLKAALDYETQILQLRHKQAEEDQQRIHNLASGFFSAGVSGGPRGLGQFVRSQATGLGSNIVGNLASMGFKDLGLTTHLPVSGPLADMLKGTAFAPDATIGIKTSIDKTATATGDSAEILKQILGVLTGKSVGPDGTPASAGSFLGGSTGGIPNWILGAGPLGSAATSTTSSIIQAVSSGGNPQAILSAARSLTSGLNSLIPGPNGNGFLNQSVQLVPGIASTGGQLLGAGVQVAGGALTLNAGLHGAGVQGSLQAGAGAASIVGGILPLISSALSLAGPVGMIASAALGIASAIMGDPRTNRQNQINNRLQADQFYAPTPIQATMDVSGYATSYDRYGNVRVSPGVGPYPTVEEPYYDFRHHVLVPGRTVSQVGGTGPGTPTININALDSQSFSDAAKRNPHAFADGVISAINVHGRTDVVEALRPNL